LQLVAVFLFSIEKEIILLRAEKLWLDAGDAELEKLLVKNVQKPYLNIKFLLQHIHCRHINL